MEDWRLQGQEKYLHGVSLVRREYQPASSTNDHDHCEFCWAKFMANAGPQYLSIGYSTIDAYRWICEECFSDFRSQFEWVLEAEQFNSRTAAFLQELPPDKAGCHAHGWHQVWPIVFVGETNDWCTGVNIIEDRIKHALSPLIGLPLTWAGRAAGMEMFTFGLLRPYVSPRGRKTKVGDYNLHLQCAWRIVDTEVIVVASGDYYYPADQDADWESFDPNSAPSRRTSRLDAWIAQHKDNPVRVEQVQCDRFGGFELIFQGEFRLQVFPDDSLTGEFSEFWRIFKSNIDDSHFVMLGGGEFET